MKCNAPAPIPTLSSAWEFCFTWLNAWTGNKPEQLANFYAEDAYYADPKVQIFGRAALLGYLRKLLKKYPTWVWRAEEIFPIQGGFTLKWVCTHPHGSFLGLDVVMLDSQMLITRNEVQFNPALLMPKSAL